MYASDVRDPAHLARVRPRPAHFTFRPAAHSLVILRPTRVIRAHPRAGPTRAGPTRLPCSPSFFISQIFTEGLVVLVDIHGRFQRCFLFLFRGRSFFAELPLPELRPPAASSALQLPPLCRGQISILQLPSPQRPQLRPSTASFLPRQYCPSAPSSPQRPQLLRPSAASSPRRQMCRGNKNLVEEDTVVHPHLPSSSRQKRASPAQYWQGSHVSASRDGTATVSELLSSIVVAFSTVVVRDEYRIESPRDVQNNGTAANSTAQLEERRDCFFPVFLPTARS